MKILIKTAYTLSLLICILLLSCKPKVQPEKLNKIEYSREANFPKIEGLDLGVYEQAKDYKMSAAEGQEFLKKISAMAPIKTSFRPNPEMQVADETWFNNPSDPSASASFNLRNGDFSFNSGMASYINNNSTIGLLKNEEALKRAQNYIKELNLKVNEEELVVGHIGGVNQGIQENNKSTILEKFTTVRFDRQLDKVPVFGHSRLVFQMAQQGRIQSFIKQWTPYEKIKLKKEDILFTTDEMRQQFEKGILEENPSVQKIRIDKIRLVYFDDGSGRIEPALHGEGVTIEGDKEKLQEFPYDVVTPLLKSPRLVYTYDHKRLQLRPKNLDDINDNKENPRSEDDKGKRE